MKNAKEHSQKIEWKTIRQIGIGVAAGAFLCAALLALCAFIFLKMEHIPVVALTPIAIGISAVGAFLSGFIAAKLSRQRGLLYGAIAGTVLFIVIFLSSLSSSLYNVSWVAFARLGVMAFSGAIGGILGMYRKKKRIKVK